MKISFIITGEAKEVQKVIQENSLRERRGVIKFTPYRHGECDMKPSPEKDTKPTPQADTKKVFAKDDKSAALSDNKKVEIIKKTKTE